MISRSEGDLPPSAVAAERGRAADPGRAARPYPTVRPAGDLDAVSAQLAATRALLTASTPHDVVAVVAALVGDLGGALVPARSVESEPSLQIDLSFGLSEPMLPWAEAGSAAATRLPRVLPDFVADARQVFDRLQGDTRRADEAEHDALTGLLTRRAWMRRLSAAGVGDAVCIIDLDHFKAANDQAGHAGGDEVLRAVSELLVRIYRPGDACGRYGGDELVCLAPGMSAEDMAARTEQLRSSWHRERPETGAGVGLSIGVARIGDREPRLALRAADRALYRVKSGGRDATAVATPEDYAAVVEP